MSVKEELKWLTSISLLSWLFSSLYVPKKVCMCDSVVVVRIRAAGGCGVEVEGGGLHSGVCCEKKMGMWGATCLLKKPRHFITLVVLCCFFLNITLHHFGCSCTP